MQNANAQKSVNSLSSTYQVGGLRKKILDRFYGPDFVNGTAQFYTLVRECLQQDTLILDLGAGTGENAGNPDRYIDGSKVIRVGLDVDSDIAENPLLNHKVIGSADALPFASETFDLVFSDFVFEHISKPHETMAEIYRILKKGGYFLYRTNNFYHYVTLASFLTPHSLHVGLKRKVTATNIKHDPYPTVYKFNSAGRMKRILQNSGFENVTLMHVEKEPSYLMFHWAPLMAGVLYERTVNGLGFLKGLRANIFGICQK